MKKNKHPKGWDKDRIKRVLEHYENQTDEEAMLEDEAAFEGASETTMRIPTALITDVGKLISTYNRRVA